MNLEINDTEYKRELTDGMVCENLRDKSCELS